MPSQFSPSYYLNGLFFTQSIVNTISQEPRLFVFPYGQDFVANEHIYNSVFPLSFQFQDGFFVMNLSELDIHLYEESYSDLIKELSIELDFLWDFYVKSDITKLDSSAVRLRNFLVRYIIQVN